MGIDNNYGLSQLDLTGMKQLRDLSCEGNSITSLNLSDCRNLVTLVCNNNQLSALDVSGLDKLEVLTCFSNDLSSLNLTGCTSLRSLDCSVNPKLSIADFPRSLTSLNCSSCSFSQIETPKLPLLTNLTCDGNQIGTLDLSAQTKLTAINCSNNKIKQLDFNNCVNLLDVVIAGNPINGGISFANCNNLRYVSVNNTKLDACALNDMYRSLREKRPEDENNDLHGILLFNNVPGAVEVSRTQIATDKGWLVSNVGDGTGCQEDGVAKVSTESQLYVNATDDGWIISNLPADAREVLLTTLGGQVVARYHVTAPLLRVKAPRKGVYIVSVDGGNSKVCIQK